MSTATEKPPLRADWVGPDGDEEDLDWHMQETYTDLTRARQTRSSGGHKQDSFFCMTAGSSECLALGHDQDNLDEDIHYPGWDGEILCTATKYDTACSDCEGECAVEDLLKPLDREAFWALFRAPEVPHG